MCQPPIRNAYLITAPAGHSSGAVLFGKDSARSKAKEQQLATRQARIDEFIHEGSPPFNKSLEVLCEDHNGTYVLPFLCQFRDGVWQNAKTRRAIEAEVIGWRPLNRNQS